MRKWTTYNTDALDVLRVIAWITALLLSLAGLAYQQGYRLNTSQSYPPGLYLLNALATHYQVGDLVLFCPPDNDAIKLGLDRQYIEAGRCHSHTVPIIKRIAAMEFDSVALDALISINDQILPNTTILTLDAKERPLPAYTYRDKQTFVMPHDTAFLYSDHAPKISFDSRYFGIVPLKNIQGIIKPIWIFRESTDLLNHT